MKLPALWCVPATWQKVRLTSKRVQQQIRPVPSRIFFENIRYYIFSKAWLGYPKSRQVFEKWIRGLVQFSSVQFSSLSHVQLFLTPWTAAHQVSLSVTNSQSLLKLMSIELVMPSSHLILCRPLLLLPSNSPSIRVLSNMSVLPIRWPKYWSFSFILSPSNKYSGLISFRSHWFGFLTVQGTLKSLLKHQSSKTSILQRSAFSMV